MKKSFLLTTIVVLFISCKTKDQILYVGMVSDYEAVKPIAHYYTQKFNRIIEDYKTSFYHNYNKIRLHYSGGEYFEAAKVYADSMKLLLEPYEAKKRIADSIAAVKKHRADSIAELNRMGIWNISHYVDDFGEPTKEAYITCNRFLGKFSNSATEGSDLGVYFLIDKSKDIDIKLFEYNHNNPVKALSVDIYYVLVRDKDGKKYNLRGYMRGGSDRLSIEYLESHYGSKGWYKQRSYGYTLQKILKKGGIVKFRITDCEYGTTHYSFEVNADYYKNAYRKLIEGK